MGPGAGRRGRLCLHLSLLEPAQKQAPGPLAEPLLRDGTTCSYCHLPHTTPHELGHPRPSTAHELGSPPPRPRALWGPLVTFNEIHQGTSWFGIVHLPCFILYGRRPLRAAKGENVKAQVSCSAPSLCPCSFWFGLTGSEMAALSIPRCVGGRVENDLSKQMPPACPWAPCFGCRPGHVRAKASGDSSGHVIRV